MRFCFIYYFYYYFINPYNNAFTLVIFPFDLYYKDNLAIYIKIILFIGAAVIKTLAFLTYYNKGNYIFLLMYYFPFIKVNIIKF